MTAQLDKSLIKQFSEAVNMHPDELSQWLKTEESRSVGQKAVGDEESVGHDSGRRIVKLLRRKPDYSEADVQHMRKVIGYVHRHLAQRPQGDIEHTRWRYSLMNWGHDPLKK